MRNRNMIALLFAFVLVIAMCGCQNNNNNMPTTSNGKSLLNEMPTPVYGVPASSKLEVLSWDCGRLDATSGFVMAETEQGYYYIHMGILYYADKADVKKWVPVCSKPDCNHTDATTCYAQFGGNAFVVRDNRIYFASDLHFFPGLYIPNGSLGLGLFSKALDGSDAKLEYVIEEALIGAGGGTYGSYLDADHWIYSVVKLNTDGTLTGFVYRLSESGRELLFQEYVDSKAGRTIPDYFFGDSGFFEEMMSPGLQQVFRCKNGELTATNVSDYLETGGYLSGNLLRFFRPNDGYYDADLETGEEIRIANCQLTNSSASILLPNCVIETDIAIQNNSETQNTMCLFDGESWRYIQLPEELAYPQEGVRFEAVGISSDSVFFRYRDLRRFYHLYRIDLTQETLSLEYCTRLGG